MTVNTKRLFVTGATGSIGGRLVSYFLQHSSHHITLLARNTRRNSAVERMARLLQITDPAELPRERLSILTGDVTQEALGLSPQDYAQVVEHTDILIHSAATTKLSETAGICRQINLGGTERVLQLATMAHRHGRLKRLCHISTAYVAGTQLSSSLKEDQLPDNPQFSNHYERSKYAAELRVREFIKQGLPGIIFRPSIVVGDTTSGRPGSFNVVYPLCRLVATGMLNKVPMNPKSRLNIVPIDFVVQAIALIAEAPNSLGKTFHLVSKEPAEVERVFDLQQHYPHMAHVFKDIEFVEPERFDPSKLDEDQRMVYDGLLPYLPYMQNELAFDTTNMDAILPQVGLEWPDTGLPFIRKLFEYLVAVQYIT